MQKRPSRYIKLQGHTRNCSDISGVKRIRTISSSSGFMTNEERESIESAMDFRALGIHTRREIDKFARQDTAVEKFQKNYYKARERLAGKINENRALMELRHELQRRRRRGKDPAAEGQDNKEAKPPVSQGGINEVELRY